MSRFTNRIYCLKRDGRIIPAELYWGIHGNYPDWRDLCELLASCALNVPAHLRERLNPERHKTLILVMGISPMAQPICHATLQVLRRQTFHMRTCTSTVAWARV